MNNFYVGAISSIAGSATHNLNGTLQVGSSALVGGISAELSGGNFWRGAAIGGTVVGLNHARHQIKLNNHVKAVRGFLKDSGFSSEMVIADVVKHKDSFWNKYYARFAGNVSDYGDFFSGGQWDSFSNTNDAYQSKVKHYKYLKMSANNSLMIGSEGYALKYYPSRSHSIGIIRTGLNHVMESIFEAIDGGIRKFTGYDNVLFDMHGTNSSFYLNKRRFFK